MEEVIPAVTNFEYYLQPGIKEPRKTLRVIFSRVNFEKKP